MHSAWMLYGYLSMGEFSLQNYTSSDGEEWP
jgi:hypothetical protein